MNDVDALDESVLNAHDTDPANAHDTVDRNISWSAEPASVNVLKEKADGFGAMFREAAQETAGYLKAFALTCKRETANHAIHSECTKKFQELLRRNLTLEQLIDNFDSNEIDELELEAREVLGETRINTTLLLQEIVDINLIRDLVESQRTLEMYAYIMDTHHPEQEFQLEPMNEDEADSSQTIRTEDLVSDESIVIEIVEDDEAKTNVDQEQAA